MASHLASLWKWDFLELGNGLLLLSSLKAHSVLPLSGKVIIIVKKIALWKQINRKAIGMVRRE